MVFGSWKQDVIDIAPKVEAQNISVTKYKVLDFSLSKGLLYTLTTSRRLEIWYGIWTIWTEMIPPILNIIFGATQRQTLAMFSTVVKLLK